MTDEHRCHARGCTATCRPEELMCTKHWAMVGTVHRNFVRNAYVPGQTQGNPPPSEEWMAAADAAILSVLAKEQRALLKRVHIVMPGRYMAKHIRDRRYCIELKSRKVFLDLPISFDILKGNIELDVIIVEDDDQSVINCISGIYKI